ncbi:MAG: hypothetical protein HKL87_09600 [Acidimicrobiaceae bacterium]|nr:hypothetical protein [Acidimicrobiaceae bacterium]
MAKSSSRHLQGVQRRLEAARESQRVLEEQVQTWNEALDDMRIRTLVSETPQLQADYNELSKHVVAARAELQRRSAEVSSLVRERDELLREWVPKDEHG